MATAATRALVATAAMEMAVGMETRVASAAVAVRLAAVMAAEWRAVLAKARAVVFRTYSSAWSISGRMVAIIAARPAALARLLIISLPSTRAK